MTRFRDLTLESLTVARTSSTSSAVVALVVAATVALVLATAGRSAATEAEILRSIDEAGARLVTVSSTAANTGPDAALVDRASQLTTVDWVVGLGSAIDVRDDAVPGGPTAAVRALYGEPPDELRLVSGRWPRHGEVVLSAEVAGRLSFGAAAGAVVSSDGSRRWDVVGAFEADGALVDLERVALSGPDAPATLGLMYVVADSVEAVAPIARAVVSLAGVTDVQDLAVSTPEALTSLTEVVSGQLGIVSRQQAAGAMLAGLIFVAVTMYAATSGRRRDFGRRRALGASRSILVALVIGQALWPATAGAVLGSVAGLTLVYRLTSALPMPSFTIAVAVLVLIIALIAAVPAALSAAFRDPVRVLRVP